MTTKQKLTLAALAAGLAALVYFGLNIKVISN